jgi:diguanylate cyclase (GGDEF)-like protein/PAS domain S-box-containing protein
MDQNLHQLLSYFYEGVYIVDINRKIIFWNTGSERITGYKAEDVVNKFCYNNILRHVTADGKELCFGGCPLHDTLVTGKINEAEVFLHHREGYRVPVSVKSIPLKDDSGTIVAAIEVFTDLRFRKNQQDENRELKELLTVDALTQIPNRRYLDFYLENLVNENVQFDTSFGILFFDIDDFKNVNDFFGHLIGDEVLKLVSKTLKSNVRGNDKVGRWGGEEFIAIVMCENNAELALVSEKLRILVQKSAYEIPESDIIKVTVSIGGTIFNKGENISDTINRADKLMYKAKQNGKNQSQIE